MKKNKKILKISVLISALILSIILFSCISVVNKIKNNSINKEYLNSANKVINLFRNYYYYYNNETKSEIDNQIYAGMLNGILSSDRYGRLIINQKDYEEKKENKSVGLTLKRTKYSQTYIDGFFDKKILKTNFISSTKPNEELKDTDKQLMRGDLILSFFYNKKEYYVNGLNQIDFSEIVSKLPDSFDIKIKRDNFEYIFNLNKLIYENTEDQNKKITNNTYKLYLSSFEINQSLDNILKAIEKVKNDKNIKNIVIDLRSNPGGDLRVLALLVYALYGDLDNKPMMVFRDKYNRAEKIYVKKQKDLILKQDDSGIFFKLYPNIKKAIKQKASEALVLKRNDISIYLFSDNKTASASEALIGITKNTNFSKNFKKQIGQKTYGKGVAQSVIDVNDFLGVDSYPRLQLAMTTKKYFVINKNDNEENIDKIGYLPEIEIEETYENSIIHKNELDDAIYKALMFEINK